MPLFAVASKQSAQSPVGVCRKTEGKLNERAVEIQSTSPEAASLARTTDPSRNKTGGLKKFKAKLMKKPDSGADTAVSDTVRSARVLKALAGYYNRSDKKGQFDRDVFKCSSLQKYFHKVGEDEVQPLANKVLNKTDFEQLRRELKGAGHRAGGGISSELKREWNNEQPDVSSGSTPKEAKSALRKANLVSTDLPAIGKKNDASATVLITPSPVLKTLNPLSEPHTPAHTAQLSSPVEPVVQVVTASGNPFGSGTFDTDDTEAPGLKAKPYTGDNPFEGDDEEPIVLPADNSGNTPDVSALERAALPIQAGVSDMYMGLLNAYLKTKDGNVFAEINTKHVLKVEHDIAKDPLIKKHIWLDKSGNVPELKWLAVPENKVDFEKVLAAFNGHHKVDGSFDKIMGHFNFDGMGYQVLKSEKMDEIIHVAAKQKPHMPGKTKQEAAEMKAEVVVDVLNYLKDVENRDAALPDDMLNGMIDHYARLEEVKVDAQHEAEKLSKDNQVTLNDRSVFERIKHFVWRIKTDDRLNAFKGDMDIADKAFQGEMFEKMKEVKHNFSADKVAQRTAKTLNEDLASARAEYKKVSSASNPFPEKLNPNIEKQILQRATDDYNTMLRGILNTYEGMFMSHLEAGVTDFSSDKYFEGKGYEHAAQNIIKINDGLSDVYRVAKEHHDKVVEKLTNEFGQALAAEICTGFDEKLRTLADKISEKVISNYGALSSMYNKELNKKTYAPETGGYSLRSELSRARELSKLATKLVADVNTIKNHVSLGPVPLETQRRDDAVERVLTPVLSNARNLLPKPPSIWKAVRLGFKRAFRPSVKNAALATPLILGAAVSAATPGIGGRIAGYFTAISTFFVALGNLGRDINYRLNQRNELKGYIAQIERDLSAIQPNKAQIVEEPTSTQS